MSETTIRAIEKPDISAILQIQASAKEAAQWSMAAYEKICEDPSSERGWVADRGGRLVGFLVARQAGNEMEILNLAVDVGVRRCGIGTNLLQQCLWDASKSGAEKIYLEVRVSNVAAQAFYQRRGFAPAGIRRNYYASPSEDAILLSYKQSPPFRQKPSDTSWRRAGKCDSFASCDAHSKGGADAFDGSGYSRGPDVE